MAYSQVITTFKDGAFARPADGEDHISALLMYGNNTEADILARAFTSSTQAEDYSDTVSAIEDEALFHIREFFRMSPGATLWFAQIDDAAATEAALQAELVALQDAAKGKIRQFGIVGDGIGLANAASLAAIETMAAAVGSTLADFATEHRGAVAFMANLFTVDASRVAVPPALSDTKRYVEYVIGGDANTTTNPSGYPAVGTALGSASRLRVGQSIGATTSNPIHDGSRFNEVFIGSDAHDFKVFSVTELDALANAQLNFPRFLAGNDGAWFNGDYTLAPTASDYNRGYNLRTILEADRLLNAAYERELNEDNAIVENGQLSQPTISYYESIGNTALLPLIQSGDLIPVEGTRNANIIIDPDQDVLSTKELDVTAQVRRPGVTELFNLTLGFVPSTTA